MSQSVQRARSDATTGNACRRTSFATPWSLAGMEATSRGTRAGGKEGKEGEEGPRWRRLDARSDATTAGVVPTRSPAAVATVAATLPTRGVVPFAVSIQNNICIYLSAFLYPFGPISSAVTLFQDARLPLKSYRSGNNFRIRRYERYVFYEGGYMYMYIRRNCDWK